MLGTPRSRLSGGLFAPRASLRSRGRRLKAGGSQDWLPHDLCRMAASIKNISHGFSAHARDTSYRPWEAASVTLLPEWSRMVILPFSKVTLSILVKPSGTLV